MSSMVTCKLKPGQGYGERTDPSADLGAAGGHGMNPATKEGNMHTRTWMAFGTSGALAALVAGCGTPKFTPPPPPAATTMVAERPGQLVEKSIVTMAARVVRINQRSRIVTLKNAAGETFDVRVGEEVTNLPRVRKGDDVVVTYVESIAITLRKPGEATPGVETSDAVERAKRGERPGMAVGSQTTITATVVGLNKQKGTVTLKGSKGKVVTVTAREPRRLEPVKIGDLVEVVYTEALAISVERPSAR